MWNKIKCLVGYHTPFKVVYHHIRGVRDEEFLTCKCLHCDSEASKGVYDPEWKFWKKPTNNKMKGCQMNTFDEYQQRANATAIYPDSAKLTYPVLGLNGEAGEVAEKVKKMVRDDNNEMTEDKRTELAKEVGDVLWYIAAICRDIEVSLEDVAQLNITKLESRKKRGVLHGSGDNR